MVTNIKSHLHEEEGFAINEEILGCESLLRGCRKEEMQQIR